MNFRNRFSPQMRVSMSFDPKDMRTKQSFKKDCDIRLIMGKYAKGQVVDHLAKYGGDYGFAEGIDFQQAMNLVTKAQEMFSDLPSEVRERFGNSPLSFIQFAQNKDNLGELRKMGLAKPALAPAPSSSPAAIAAPGPAQ